MSSEYPTGSLTNLKLSNLPSLSIPNTDSQRSFHDTSDLFFQFFSIVKIDSYQETVIIIMEGVVPIVFIVRYLLEISSHYLREFILDQAVEAGLNLARLSGQES